MHVGRLFRNEVVCLPRCVPTLEPLWLAADMAGGQGLLNRGNSKENLKSGPIFLQ
jgi:hypothetical protein